MAPRVYLLDALDALCATARAVVAPPPPPRITPSAQLSSVTEIDNNAKIAARRRALLAGKLTAKLAVRHENKDAPPLPSAAGRMGVAALSAKLAAKEREVRALQRAASINAVQPAASAARDDPEKQIRGEHIAARDAAAKMEDVVRRCARVERIADRVAFVGKGANDPGADVGDTRNPGSPTSVKDLAADEDADVEILEGNKGISKDETVLRTMRARIAAVESRAKSQEEELLGLRGKTASLVSERDVAVADRERVRAECREVLNKEATVVTGLRQELEKREEELETVHGRLYEFRLRTGKATAGVRAELDALRAALEEAQQVKKILHDELTGDIALLKSEKALIQHELKTAAARWVAEKADLTEQLTAEEAKAEVSSAAQVSLHEQVAQIDVERTKLEDLLAEKSAELQCVEIERNALHDELEAQRTEHGKLAVELMQTNDEFRELQTQMRAAREMYEAASNVIATELKSALDQYRALSAEHDALRARTETLEKERATGGLAQDRLVAAGARLADAKTRAPHLRLSRALQPGRTSLLQERRARRRQFGAAAETQRAASGGVATPTGNNVGKGRGESEEQGSL